ncbi:hypothetical protein GALMADRAFT_795253 [Galerina marginata CBS 339.88]|uniref:Uncharacterized protein n=1 Tax=Galerina marginata (strain CBS 339.88) TaxID=685588 RepID=A0A067SNN3_GALM3|nr:hypothetical protein GALMADRAFT_795253 [Galerina marginata CBS 339.88]
MQTSQPMNTVLVDDSDPSIHYGPGWVNKPSLLAQSDPNYPMYGTLHETVNQTDLTYSFSGSTVTACGIVASGNVSIRSIPNTLWTCSVDRVQIDSFVCWSSRSQFGYLIVLSLDSLPSPCSFLLLYLLPPCRSTLMRYITLSYSNRLWAPRSARSLFSLNKHPLLQCRLSKA